MTQKEQILKLIIKSGNNGISTNELRNATHAVDVPKCVSMLKEEGHEITSLENGDGTVTYFIAYTMKKAWVQVSSNTYGWVNKGLERVTPTLRKSKKHHKPIDLSQYVVRDQEGRVMEI